MLKCFFVNNDGGGFSQFYEFNDGTTVEEFVTARGIAKEDFAKYKFRLTRDGQRSHPAAGELLHDLDRLSATPLKIDGFRS